MQFAPIQDQQSVCLSHTPWDGADHFVIKGSVAQIEVLQVEDINLVESVQRGMASPAFQQGRIVNDPEGSGKSEHALHHFHGLVLDAYAKVAP